MVKFAKMIMLMHWYSMTHNQQIVILSIKFGMVDRVKYDINLQTLPNH